VEHGCGLALREGRGFLTVNGHVSPLDPGEDLCSPRQVRVALVLALAVRSSLAAVDPPASPLLPPRHWAVEAAQRLYELGLAPDWLPAQRAVPLAVVKRTLDEAARRAPSEAPGASPLAQAWVKRFAREFRGAGEAREGWRPVLLGGDAALGFESGAVRQAASGPPAGPAALFPVAPKTDPVAAAGAAAGLGPHLAAGVRVHATPSRVELPAVELVGALGPVALSVGHAPVGYGPSQVGGVVATGLAALDRIELMTTRPLRLPAFLAPLGDIALDLAVARFDEPRHPYHPLLWEFQLSWRPHPRLTLAARRGVMFGGTPWDGIPAGDVPLSLLGIKNDLENNIYSASMELRLPTEALLPLTAKLEWGTDDEPGAAVTWPGIVVGLSAPLVPGLPLALGVEYAYFGRGLFGHHDPFGWYGHGLYRGGWATGQAPLGDPMGGNGRALRAVASADPLEGRVRLAGVAWVQERFADNLYAPAAGGRSAGFEARAELRMGRFSVGVGGVYERGGSRWSRREVAAEAKVFF
jgi:hypothetical protein